MARRTLTSMKINHSSIFFFTALTVPALAIAHTGDGPHNGILHGFSHPFSGLDHVLAMVAVGLWAAQLQGRATWLMPLVFVAVMGLGGLLGMVTLPTALAEHGIMLSLLILGALLAWRKHLPLGVGIGLIALFALSHGYAHGSEMPPDIPLLTYAAGFMFATLLLHLIGIGLALWFGSQSHIGWIRFGGIMIAGYGGFLTIQSIAG